MIAGRNMAGWWGIAGTLTMGGLTAVPLLPASGAAEPAAVHHAAPSRLPAEGAGKAAEARAKLSEIKVAIAWLADPVTFPCSLRVRPLRFAMLEITGAVPSKETHAQAVERARANSDLSILDALTVHPGTPPHPREESAVRLNLDATNALMEPAYRGLRDLEVQAHPDGEIAIFGSVPSYEEKLAVSQRLSRVPGCTCVANRLDVLTISVTGMPYSVVTVDRRLLTPAEVAVPAKPPTPNQTPAAPATANQTASILPHALPTPRQTPAPTVAPAVVIMPVAPAVQAPATVTRAFFEAKAAAPLSFVVTPVPSPGEPAKGPSVPVVQASFPTPAATKPSAPAPDDAAPLRDWYRRRIAKECGLDPQCVSVTFPTSTNMTVGLHAVDADVAGRAFAKISHIPELSPYLVKIEVEAGRK